MVRAMCGVQLKDRKRSTYLIFILAMANNVHWHGHVLRREDGHVNRRAF